MQTNRGRRVQEKARAFGLDEEQAKALALEAYLDDRWLHRKFKKFILDNVSAEEVDSMDSVFPGWDFFRPAREQFEKVLGSIYDARSGNLHQGDPFPPGVGLGTSTTAVPMHVLLKGLGPKDVPPVAWFERVVVSVRKTQGWGCEVVGSLYGSRIVKLAPRFLPSLSATFLPLCNSTICLTMDSPSPRPPRRCMLGFA